jgi:uncharacterized repeat protein (TIGR03803 family)
MQSKRQPILFVTAFTMFFGLLATATSTFAESSPQVLYNFGAGTDGYNPVAGLILDAAGNLYGTTQDGGAYGGPGYGTVFELSPNADGTWTETVLHSFGNGTDGSSPQTSLIFDGDGNLYGTTPKGGTYGKGTIFRVAPGSDGAWAETVLHSLTGGGDGSEPGSPLTIDPAGNLYGTTEVGGAYTFGTAFELSPGKNGGWTETVLHSFSHNGKDGYSPRTGLTFDAAGNLYGTTFKGGTYDKGCPEGGGGCGTVFKLSPGAKGKWTETLLHSFQFNATDGRYPDGALAFDAGGSLYGTTSFGGRFGYGTIFQLMHGKKGAWTETTLIAVNGGGRPNGPLLFDAAGNLYGTVGPGHNPGVIFKLTFINGKWTEDAAWGLSEGFPSPGPILDAAGNIYDTDYTGGSYTYGIVFEIAQ